MHAKINDMRLTQNAEFDIVKILCQENEEELRI